MTIEVDRLSKSYGALDVLDNISFEATDGDITAILGPSGCGKTTLLRCIAGLERPDGGVIRSAGEVVTDVEEAVHVPPQKRDIGIIFQHFHVWPHMTVFDNVAYPLEVEGLPSAEIEERTMDMLEMCDIDDLRDKNSSNLSGGQQTRVGFCRALVPEPQILLCDEPLTGLDKNLRKQLRTELKRLQSNLGTTTLYVTHSQSEAMSLSDEIILLNRTGQIEQSGSPEELYTVPETRYAFEFLGSSNLLEGTITSDTTISVDFGEISHDNQDLDSYREGDRVLVGIRPHHIEVARSEHPQWKNNVWEAEVVHSEFLGEHYDITCRVGRDELRLTSPSEQIAESDRIFVHFPDDHTLVLDQ